MHQPEHLILLLSDLQVGLKTPTYDLNEFIRRWGRLTSAVLRLRDIHATDRPIPKLWIAAAGDFVEGEPYTYRVNLAEMAPDTKWNRPADLLEQKQFAGEVIAEGLRHLSEVFDEVEFVGVGGNHGANRGKLASKRSNDDLELYFSLRDKLPNIKFQIETDTFYKIFSVQGHNFLLIHGHQIRFWSRTPLYGIINAVTLWHQAIPQPFEYVIMGHFHSLNYISAVGTPVYINGAFFDDDDYSIAMGMKPSANQWLMGVHPKYGVTWERRLWLK